MSELLPIAFAIYPILLSGIALALLFMLQYQSWLHWSVWVLACSSIMVFVFVAGSWAFSSYYLRYVLLGLFAIVVVFSYYRTKRSGFYNQTSDNRFIVPSVLLLLFTVLDILVITSYFPAVKKFDVAFPFKSGNYYVLQGGASTVSNPFHALVDNRLAIDIVKLNPFGNRADGIAPRALSAYQIFGETLYSPCHGSVFEVRDSLPDNAPGNPDTEYTEGNYIVLKCAKTKILMAHLKQGSIKVAQGEVVSVGQALAEIGNSGNTLEPHLHIDAMEDDIPIGLSFDGQWLSINSLIKRM